MEYKDGHELTMTAIKKKIIKRMTTIRFETNLNASMTMKIFPASEINMKRQILKQFPDAFNIEL
jgi:hypothetical protein